MSKNLIDCRVPLPSECAAKVTFHFGERRHEGRIVELTNGGMYVALGDAHAKQLAPGTQLATCTIQIPGVLAAQSLEGILIEDVDGADNDSVVLQIASQHPATRARLALAFAVVSRLGASSADSLSARELPKLPKVPGRGVSTEDARLERLQFARSMTGAPLDNMQETSLSAEQLAKNIEGFIGSVEIPVGLAGPLLFQGEHARGLILAPFATTEGALVASVTRGATALSRSGGVASRVLHQRMMRAPTFEFRDGASAALFARWIPTLVDVLSEEIRKVSGHAKLISLEPYVIGRITHVVFQYTTGDAAGQNMTTTATWHACQWVLEQLRHIDSMKLELFQIDGNMAGDKKFSFHSLLRGRGFRVMAECYLSRQVVEEVLKVTPELLLRANEHNMTGTFQAGTFGYCLGPSNPIAAIFTATGQDIACVHESSGAILTLRRASDGVYASTLLPCLVAGTIGGGTHLPRQREMLQLMGCVGDGRAPRLAEIIAGFCLASDLSALAAAASDQFADAHERLGRNKPMQWLKREDLSSSFFARSAQRLAQDDAAVVVQADAISAHTRGSRISAELQARNIDKLVGLLPYRLHVAVHGRLQEADAMVKVKPLTQEVAAAWKGIATQCNAQLSKAYGRFASHTCVEGCDVRELAVYSQSDPRLLRHMPAVYDVHQDPTRGAFILVMELLEHVQLLDSMDDVSGWRGKPIEAALEGAAAFHSIWIGREQELLEQPWIGTPPSCERMSEATPLWLALAAHAAEAFPEWYAKGHLARQRDLIARIPEWWPILERQARTLIHNDFNPSNLCFKTDADRLRLIAYDWELSTLHVPQHDLAELLVFTLSAKPDREEIDHYVEYHRRALERLSGRPIDSATWREGYRYSLCDLAIHRIPLTLMEHTVRGYSFMERVTGSLCALMDLEGL